MTVAIIATVLVGALLLAYGRFAWRRTGLPGADILGADTGIIPPLTLASEQHRLVGRPDYLVRNEYGIIPVELKSAEMPRKGPHRSHKMQVAAYCLLAEEHFGEPVPYGLLRYRNGSYKVEFTAELRTRLLRTVTEVHTAVSVGSECHISHSHINRCTKCRHKASCGENLLK